MHAHEKVVLKALAGKNRMGLKEISEATGLSADAVRRACHLLSEKKLVELTDESIERPALSEEGLRFLKDGFPEQHIAQKAASGIPLEALSDEEKRVGIPWAVRNGWVEFRKAGGTRMLFSTPAGSNAAKDFSSYELSKALSSLSEGRPPSAIFLEALRKRGLVITKSVNLFSARATEEGAKAAAALEGGEEIRALSKELITSGGWRSARLQAYDVAAPVERVFPGKPHPLTLFIEKIRRTFLNMGFEEMSGPCVESAFWNFDALFQPQDHPARELHDTFYLKQPKRFPLPERGVVDRVRRAHEKGWGYAWDDSVASQALLRTHTTAVSARYLADIRAGKRSPSKYFAIGRVFRNEATDFKHLAEFHQVEGIVVWEKANFRHLLGLLNEFYSRLGFKRLRFRPHYFPYTEPSLEIEAFFEEKNTWIELGGAGIFRPEVCLPLWGKYPVLAWGLSLERPLMLLTGLNDIRTFYRNDLGWLRSSPEVKTWQW